MMQKWHNNFTMVLRAVENQNGPQDHNLGAGPLQKFTFEWYSYKNP